MDEDALLLWMSAKGSGSWQQFRSAVEQLNMASDGSEHEDAGSELPIYQLLRLNLERLGHAEFFWDQTAPDWRVCPPTLAVTETESGWNGILTGARSMATLERLSAACGPCVMTTERHAMTPLSRRIFATSETAIAAMAQRANIAVQLDAPKSILRCMPAIDALLQPTDRPFGKDWRVERYSTRTLRWKPSEIAHSLTASAGLFRYTLGYRRSCVFVSAGDAFSVSPQVGKFLNLRRRGKSVLRYDPERLELTFPASCRPPILIERALVLSSGILPSETRNSSGVSLAYGRISPMIASLAASRLCQDLR
jgi:hypothetical protein